MTDSLSARSIRRHAALIGVALISIVLLASFAVVSVSATIRDVEQRAFEVRDIADTAQHLLQALTDAETGERGFLLTLQTEELHSMAAVAARVGLALDQLDRFAASHPWLATEAGSLRTLSITKLADLNSTIAQARGLSQAGGQTEAGVVKHLETAIMQEVRRHVGAIVQRSFVERDALVARLRTSEIRVLLAALAGLVAAVSVLGFMAMHQLLGRARLSAAQAALRLQSNRLQATVDQIRDAVAVFDPADRLLLWNDHFFPTVGLPERLARSGVAFAEIAAAASGWSPPLLEGPRPTGGIEVREVERDGSVLEVWRSRLPDGGQMIAAADITRRTQAEAVARQAYKMEALGQLTGGVAHDFNNLLQVIYGNLELLGKILGKDQDRTRRLDAAMAGVARGARLTRHLLAFARRQPLAPTVIDLRHLLAGMEDMLRRTLGALVSVEMVVPDDLWTSQADPQQLENAILNLAINARDAMPNGGRLTITAGNSSLDAAQAADDAAPGDYVVITVTDTGIGMTEAQLARAVEPFYTTKPEGVGTGLGLPMVYGFARQSGGSFRLFSRLGSGTTARLCLPRSQLLAPPAVSPAAPAMPAAAGELVLVVEDDEAVREVAAQALHMLGYRTIEAADPAAALALLRGGAKPDVLLSDVVMPGPISAIQLAEQARLILGSKLPVLFTSGHPQDRMAGHDACNHFANLLDKPWRIEDLATKLRAAL